MEKPKFKIGQKVRVKDKYDTRPPFIIGKIINCRETFEKDYGHEWAYGRKDTIDEECTFEKFLEVITPLEELL